MARSFGKCPGCYRDLPEGLQLSPREVELKEMEETWRAIEERRNRDGTVEIFPTPVFPKEKQAGKIERPLGQPGRLELLLDVDERSKVDASLGCEYVDAAVGGRLVESTCSRVPKQLGCDSLMLDSYMDRRASGRRLRSGFVAGVSAWITLILMLLNIGGVEGLRSMHFMLILWFALVSLSAGLVGRMLGRWGTRRSILLGVGVGLLGGLAALVYVVSNI